MQRFFELTDVHDVSQELKEVFAFTELETEFDSLVRVLSKHEYGHLFSAYQFDSNVFHYLRQGLQSDITVVSSELEYYAECVKDHFLLLKNLRESSGFKSAFKIGASILGGAIAGPLGAIGARGISGSFFNDDSAIGESMQEVAVAWDGYGDELDHFIKELDDKYRYVMLSLYGGLFLSVNQQLKQVNIEIKDMALNSVNYELGLTKKEARRVQTWALETIESIQLKLKKQEYQEASFMANQFYHYVDQHPVMSRTEIKEEKSLKYVANVIKLATINHQAATFLKRNEQEFRSLIVELYKQQPMLITDDDVTKLGAPSQAELFLHFIHISLKENDAQALSVLFDYTVRMIDRMDQGEFYIGEYFNDDCLFHTLIIVAAQFAREKRKQQHPLFEETKKMRLEPKMYKQIKALYKPIGPKDKFDTFLTECFIGSTIGMTLNFLLRPLVLPFKNKLAGGVAIVLIVGLIGYFQGETIKHWGESLVESNPFTTVNSETVQEERYLTITTDGANIRETPSLEGALVTAVGPQVSLLFLQEEQMDHDGRLWYYIKTEDGRVGWISSTIVE